MTDRFRRLRAAFDAAHAEPDPIARERIVNEACAGDPAMLAELRAMLANAPADDFLAPPPAAEPVGEPPPQLGEFQLLRDLSEGRGVVWLAHQPSLDRMVAIKVMHAGAGTPTAQIERFHREPMAVARLNHPHIVPVYAEGRAGNTHWFAMQYIEGQSLDRELRQQHDSKPNATAPLLPRYGTGPWFAAVARVCADAADALQAAHERGIVHRDVKPANLLLDRHGNVFVADFGIARDETLGSLTEPGTIAGTWHYMSPEQARIANVPVDHRTDIYSLGVVMYEMLTLTRPFEGRTSQEVLDKIRTVAPRAIRRCNANVPRDLETICNAAMAREASARYATAGALRDDLQRFLQHEAIQQQPPSLGSRLLQLVRCHRHKLAVTGAVAMALALGFWAQSALATSSSNSLLRQQCEEVARLENLDEAPADQLAELRRGLSSGLDSTMRATAERLDAYKRHLRDTGVTLLRPQVTTDPTSNPVRLETMRRGLGALIRARMIFGDDAELTAAMPSDPLFAAVDVTLQDDLGQPVTGEVTAHLVDGLTGMPGPERVLGRTPLVDHRLPEGMYHFVVKTSSGERCFVRTLQALRRSTMNLTLRPMAEPPTDMVRLAGGSLQLPAEGSPPSGLAGKSFDVAPFWIDRCEVSVGQYREFVTATNRKPPFGWAKLVPGEHDRLPVVNVSLDDAVAYAEWRGKRLPTYPEWALAARGAGPQPRPFPWLGDGIFGNCKVPPDFGDDGTSRFASYLAHAQAVDQDPASCTPEGVFEMFGNVAEWTGSPGVDWDGTENVPVLHKRIVAGFAWFVFGRPRTPVDLGATNLSEAGPLHTHFARGFRCARSTPR